MDCGWTIIERQLQKTKPGVAKGEAGSGWRSVFS
jgi:hypothetical protein